MANDQDFDHEYDEVTDPDASEVAVQKQLFAEFNAALKSGDKAEAERIARMFLAYPWERTPGTSGAFAMRMFIARTDAAQREKEGHENICILRNCLYKKWNYSLAISTLEEIDRLRKDGWTVCADDRELIEGCRLRCEEYVEAQKREARWNKLCGDLRAAVDKRDAAAVTHILSAPEFRRREPEDESLMLRAERILDRRGYSEMKFKLVPVIAIVAALVGLLAISARASRARALREKCSDEVEKLEALMETFDPIEQISSELDYLRMEEPEVLSQPHVFAFIEKLEKMKADNAVRTNEIASLLGELESIEKNGWNDADSVTIDKIERVDQLLKPHDIAFAKRLTHVKEAAIEFAETKRDTKRKDAERYVLRLIPILDSVSRRLEVELPDDELASLASKCGEALGKWDAQFAKGAPELNDRLAASRRRFEGARHRQEGAVAALEQLKSATRAIDVLTSRNTLRLQYADYPPMAALPPIPYSADDVRGVLNGLAEGVSVQDGDKLERIGIRRVYSAGKIKFDPMGAAYRRDKGSIVPQVVSDAARFGSLYILRPNGRGYVLRRALKLRENGKWGIVSYAVKDDLILGEPLFVVR